MREFEDQKPPSPSTFVSSSATENMFIL